MFDFTRLTKKDLEDLKVFKSSFIWILLTSIAVIGVMVFTYINYDLDRLLYSILVFFLGFTYKPFITKYIHNYKRFRLIMDKARGKK